jgi:hypothetical protein
MTGDASGMPGKDRRPWAILGAALGLLLAHELTALAAAHAFRPLAHGYADAELLAPGGDLALELVLAHESPLRAAIGTAGVWLLAGRIPSFVAAFFLYQATFAWAWSGPVRPRPESTRPLHALWALPTVLFTTLASSILAGSLLFGLLQLRRALVRAEVPHAAPILWSTALAGVLLWAVAEVWLDLHRLAVAGARLRPWNAARLAGHTWRRNLPLLAAARVALGAVSLAATAGGTLLLPAMTRGERSQQLVASWTIDLGLLGAICLRAAWLTWASAHLPAVAPAESGDANGAGSLSPESSAAAQPSGGPDAQDDPSPGPDA